MSRAIRERPDRPPHAARDPWTKRPAPREAPPLRHDVGTSMAEPASPSRHPVHCPPRLGGVGPDAAVTAAGSAESSRLARPPPADRTRLHRVDHDRSPFGGRRHPPAATSRGIALSHMVSAHGRGGFASSASDAFARLASASSMPPYLAFRSQDVIVRPPCLWRTSAAGRPVCCALGIAMNWSSPNLGRLHPSVSSLGTDCTWMREKTRRASSTTALCRPSLIRRPPRSRAEPSGARAKRSHRRQRGQTSARRLFGRNDVTPIFAWRGSGSASER